MVRISGFHPEGASSILVPGSKYCRICKTEKNVSEFNKNVSKKDGLETCCRLCRRAHMRNYYAKNSKRRIQLNTESRIKRKAVIIQTMLNYLDDQPCVDCGESDILVLDFDHLRNKKFNISAMVHSAMKWEIILVEISKCVVRCANCHRRKTAKERNWAKLAALVER